eukprot:Seg2717.3 transcript_id=Seg2717.3/GoldUCD/mRNA.D3Y31 product="DIS3-like exonuclease 2" protein_id=Seg2717.3/GoldUCD/D3Y31
MLRKVPCYLKVITRIQKRTDSQRRYIRHVSYLRYSSVPPHKKRRLAFLQNSHHFSGLPLAGQFFIEMDEELNVKTKVMRETDERSATENVEVIVEPSIMLSQSVQHEDFAQGAGKSARKNKKRNRNRNKNKGEKVGDGYQISKSDVTQATSNSKPPVQYASGSDVQAASGTNETSIETFIKTYSQPAQSSPKQVNDQRHTRNFHSETTPSKGGLPKMNCNEYWSPARVEDGKQEGKVMEGAFRISQRNYNNAYISSPDGIRDILIDGVNNRNRALQGDIVAVEYLEEDTPVKREVEEIARKLAIEFNNVQITEDNIKQTSQKRGRVVRIVEEKHSRMVAGMLKPFRNNSYGFALMSPQDSRLPRVMIPLNECPEEFVSRPQDFESVLFTAQIINWKRTCALASGRLIRQLGEAGAIEPETEGFLTEYNVDFSEFPDDAIACLPQDLPWRIPTEEYTKRRDLREECIFTIDPATARDLDDALSCKVREDGNLEIGVHIADVSFFIEEGNALDKVAADRATSVYLIQRVVPMLPRLLCEHLCSLNPGEDKLTYSVIWTLTPDGKVINEWFGRSVIRSCSKLAYEHAQQMIECDNADLLDWTQFSEINGGHSINNIHAIVNQLYQLSLILRKKRFDAGALALNQPKLSFTLDRETGMPNGCGCYVARDSNRLVEEFMLLANMAVAHRLMRSLPDKALLRRHPSPNPKMIEDLINMCKRCEVGLDAEDSKRLHDSLERLRNSDLKDKESLYYAAVSLCSKPMQLAKYFCAGAIEDEAFYRHYALNVPLYTHFTSPIRRYPDIIVHRMLTAALQEGGNVRGDVQELQKVAEHCNDKKASSKKVQELSSELFFGAYVRQVGELHENAVIVGMLDSAIDVLLLHSGFVKRIYCNALPLGKWKLNKEHKDTMTLYWKNEEELASESNQASGSSQAANNKNGKGSATPKGTVSNANVEDETSDTEFNRQQQILQMFDKLDVIIRSERKDNSGPYKVNVYIPRPEKVY